MNDDSEGGGVEDSGEEELEDGVLLPPEPESDESDVEN